MKRGYTALEYKSIVRKLRAERPELSVTSDFIIGFPASRNVILRRRCDSSRT
jgi:tRNA A37 methylthiotransferase MiaB